MEAIFGPVLGGLIYRKTKNVYLVFVGEVFGTGVIGACASYPLMKMFYGLDAQSPFYYIPFYTPSAIVGAAMGVVEDIHSEHPTHGYRWVAAYIRINLQLRLLVIMVCFVRNGARSSYFTQKSG